ncbi:unnamed protein product [Heligmosomoides polygyrus]|uniref:Ig-like domain-containing protein n=1 Tax=Heligmosomoides polygyrus TaxID=6339 RepID=A0A183GMY2_HELPZ|nr:unnamed protein product [Heligmosomoides polygyrus]
MTTLKTRCDAKNVLRCSPADDVADVPTESIDVGNVSVDVASDVGVANVGDVLSVTCRSVGDASPKYNIGHRPKRERLSRGEPRITTPPHDAKVG